MSDIIFWILIFFVLIIIIGLYISEYTPLDLNEKEKILMERFTPSVSSSSDQDEGASGLFNWGLPDDDDKKCNHSCKPSCPVQCPQKCPSPPPPPKPVEKCAPMPVNNNEICTKCDITLNKDLNKYVLKSSIPACPDMSEFVTKNMVNANPDLSDYILKTEIKPCDKVDVTKYILKSEIPHCDKVDISQYILKSSVPACPTCPICPECPICPVIPAQQKCKEVHEYSIKDHPDMSKYISLAEVNEKYVLKDKAYNCDGAKDYLSKSCGQKQSSQPPSQPSSQQSSQQPSQQSSQKSKQNNTKDIFEEEFHSSLLDNVLGYYAGDSLFAGV